MKRFLLHIVLILVSWSSYAQQDFLNSQYMFNLYNINPAYTGSRDVVAASLSHRTQWVGFDGAPTTQVLSVHAPVTKMKIGVGLQLFNDAIGPRQMNGFNTSYAYHLKVGQGKIGFGLRAGLLNYTYRWDKLEYEDGKDAVIGVGNQSGMKLNFDGGVYYKDRLQYAGLEIAHVASMDLTTTTTEMQLRQQLALFYGRAIELNDNLVLKLSVLARGTDASGVLDMNVSAFFKKKIWIGATVRSAGALIFMAEYYVTKAFRIGYSYDFYYNGLKAGQSGSHEIFIGYDINIFKSKMLSPRYF